MDEIAVYTYEEEIPLWQVFKIIAQKENFEKTIDHKASKKDLENYFREILPEYDEDRLYPSHMKKIIQWYNILQQSDILKSYLEEKETQEANKKK